MAAILGMQQVLAEIPDVRVGVLVDPDQIDLPSDPLAAHLKTEHRRDLNRRGDPGQIVTQHLGDLLLVPLRVRQAA